MTRLEVTRVIWVIRGPRNHPLCQLGGILSLQSSPRALSPAQPAVSRYPGSWRAPWTRWGGPCSHPAGGRSCGRAGPCAPRRSRVRAGGRGRWTAGRRCGTARRTAGWGRGAPTPRSCLPSSTRVNVPSRRNRRHESDCCGRSSREREQQKKALASNYAVTCSKFALCKVA